jgi:uroporphyrinogen decarboxylase
MSNQMNSRERVLCAMNLEIPDRVPWIESELDEQAVFPLMGKGSGKPLVEDGFDVRSVDEEKEIARFLGKDNISYNIFAPMFCDKITGKDGRVFYGKGHIQSEKDLDKLVLPDPTEDSLYQEAEKFVKGKEDFAACALSRLGIGSAMYSLGMEDFFLKVYENPKLVIEVLKQYTEWSRVVLKRLCDIGFDFLWICDDIAFKTGPMFSPKMYREMFLPHLKRAAEVISIPWLHHSDGNLLPLMEDWLSLGESAINPIDPNAMDINYVKETYGHRVCIVGNINVDTLAAGTPEEVEAEVKLRIRDLAPGGGYILASGNSIPAYVKPQNLLAMSLALKRYGRYPISIE